MRTRLMNARIISGGLIFAIGVIMVAFINSAAVIKTGAILMGIGAGILIFGMY